MIHSCGRMTSSFRSKGPAASSPRRSAVRFRCTTSQSSPHAARPTSASTTRKFSNSSASARMKSTACVRVAPFRKQRSARRSAMPAMTAQTMNAVHTGTLWRLASARMPTRWGMFDAIGYERDVSNGRQRVETALAIVMGDPTEGVPLLRIHSQCFTGEMLGSLRCDCGDQLAMAMQAIAEEGRGLVIYEYQEGRGIGLMAKLEAYELQDGGLDTVEANHALGYKADCRNFDLPAAILRDLGITRVRLLTNNPQKSRALAEAGIQVLTQIPCQGAPARDSLPYLRTKKEKLGHTLNVWPGKDSDEFCQHSRFSVAEEDFKFADVEEAVREL